MSLHVDLERLCRELETLAQFSDTPSPSVTRIVFSEMDRQARAYVKDLCAEAKLAIREDAVGNTFARWQGREPESPAIGTGSHLDAIPNAGRFDGTVGVLGGLEAIRSLQRAGFAPRRSIELLVFTSEEPTRFGLGCLGSRLLCGSLDDTAGERLHDREGKSLNQARTEAGFAGPLASVRLPNDYYAGFLELHIEQGPLLERENIPLGVVTAIAAPASLRLTLEGEGGHAGTVLMPERHDAFVAAAEIALAVERAARGTGALDTVATVGVCEVFPGAVNSIPSRVRMELDVRDTDGARRDEVLRSIAMACEEATTRRGVHIRSEVLNADAPAQCDSKLVEALALACTNTGLAFRKMVSRAYHDALFMSRVAPVAMLFIPCRGGVSHRPDEYASPEAIAHGTTVLAHALALLAD
ncbi:M20 family metallo-hydrolase [candidate division KSB1 bacterium]|nr:M20 family metallo-hydrolase [candidate division KSB1 bacterium]